MPSIKILSYFIAPVVAILILGYMNYRFKVKTNRYILQAFLLGIISIVLVIAGQLIAEATNLDDLRNLKRTAFYGFVLIAFMAELGKFIILRSVFVRKKSFRGPVDGIIYSLMINMGFATVATILFACNVIGLKIDLLYVFTYPVACIIFSIIMGFFVGLGKVRANKFIDSMTGLFAATIFHGLYNFAFLTKDYRLLILFATGSIIISFLLVAKALNVKADDKLNQTP